MEKIIYRQNKMFCIDKTKLKPQAQKEDIYLALYGAIYTEFLGAIDNQEYANLNSMQKLEKVNEFATNWLNERRLL